MDVNAVLNSAINSHQAGDWDTAGRLYASVLRAQPDSADAWHLSGVMALQLGRVQQAIQQIELALQLEPQLTDAWSNLASAQLSDGQPAAAERSCRECLSRDKNHPRGRMLLGNALRQLGQSKQALPHYQQAAEIAEDDALAWCNYGACLLACGCRAQARHALGRALQLEPQLSEAAVNLGAALRRSGELQRAEEVLRDVLARTPDHVEALIQIAKVCRDQAAFDEAERHIASALAAQPASAAAWNLQGLLRQESRPQEALESLRRAAELEPESFVSSLLYAVSSDFDSEACFQEHVRWASLLPAPVEPPQRGPTPSFPRKLRIGLLSGDFCNHALSRFLLSWLGKMDSVRFQLHLFSELEQTDEVTEQFKSLAHRWTETCGVGNQALAEAIQSQQIDVLIDLAGHTARNRVAVMNWRPAPIQISFLGYPNTTGLRTVDYYITDEHRDPPGAERLYTEKLVRMPGGAVCFMPPPGTPDISEPPVARHGHLTLGSFHRLSKLNANVLSLWRDLASATPDTRIVVVRDSLRSPVRRHRLLAQLSAAGIDAGHVELRWDWQGSYFDHYQDVDALLPVFPWGGGTTTYEAMWMGVLPLVARSGHPSSRAAVAALCRTGMEDWVGETTADLQRVCRRLARVDEAARLRVLLRTRMETRICDGQRYAAALGQTLQDLWQSRYSESLASQSQYAAASDAVLDASENLAEQMPGGQA